MSISLKAKQVASMTLVVGLAVSLLTGWYLATFARVQLDEVGKRTKLLADLIYERAQAVVATGVEPVDGLRNDPGVRSILEASLYDNYVVYAAVVDVHGNIVAISVGPTDRTLEPAEDLEEVLKRGPIAQAKTVYSSAGKMLEFRRSLLISPGDIEIGSIRIGISTLLIQSQWRERFKTPLYTALGALIVATFVSMLLAQLLLKPIHVIQGGLARLGRGELDVNVDLPSDSDFGDLGASFKAVTARIAADRTALAGQKATLESVMSHLEDAVALFAPDGALLFANPAMRAALGGEHGAIAELLPADHPYRLAVENTLAGHPVEEPIVVDVPDAGARLVLARAVNDVAGQPMGAMLVARNLAYLSQVESTLSYSHKLAALGRLSAGVAHEIKNPLNATMIHLELLKMQLEDQPAVMEHVNVIAAQVRRLDEVVQGFLKFTRPEEIHLQPTSLPALFERLLPVIRAEGTAHGVDVRLEYPSDLPSINADANLLEQAFLNLALNACQAMPNGGRLRIVALRRSGGKIEIRFEDTGSGIAPDQLPRIFDLYFTTKVRGSGIGLSLVYRTVQLHDGEIAVESVPGRGATFKVVLRQANESPTPKVARAAS